MNAQHKQYLAMERKERVAYFADEKKRLEMRSAGYYPVPVKLSWSWDGGGAPEFQIRVSTSRDLEKGSRLTATKTETEITNLEIGRGYYWQVCAVVDGQRICSPLGAFTTENQAPRLLRVDGVPNVRDLGGWKTLSGKRVRQGMVYRTAGLNDNAKVTLYTKEEQKARGDKETIKSAKKGKNRLTPETSSYLLDELGIRSDIDLRSSRECWGMQGSPMGERAKWFHYSSSAYGSMQKSSGKEAFTRVFKVFLDESNYPLLFHCIAGQDRTGAVAFIINGLLGVAVEDLYLDWEVTGFWNKSTGFRHDLRFDHLVAGFEKVPGANMHEKIENYVLSLGFTSADLEKLRTLLLE